MKKITIELEEKAHQELTQWLNFHKLCGQEHSIEYQFIFKLLYEIYRGSSSTIITQECLLQGMKKI